MSLSARKRKVGEHAAGHQVKAIMLAAGEGTRCRPFTYLELLEFLEKELGIKPSEVNFGPWRLADQKVYISNTWKAKGEFSWEPKVSREEGIRRLYEWMKRSSA